MGLAGLSCRMEIFIKDTLGLEGRTVMATLGPTMESIEAPLRIMLGMDMVRKRQMICFFKAFFNMAIEGRAL